MCPELINATNLAVKDVVMAVGKGPWKTFSNRIKHVASPEQVAQFNIQCAQSKFWAFEILEALTTSLADDQNLKHLYPEFSGHTSSLEWHMDFLRHVIETRSMSITVFHCTPPSMYCHALSPEPEVARQACEMAVAHWGMLLKAEDAQLSGVDVKCLDTCYWRLNPLVRTLYLAYEQDAAMAGVGTEESAAAKLQLLFTKHLGDSRLVENLHQQCKDLFRGTKADSMSMTAIMAHALRSNVLESRGLNTVSFQQVEKVLGSWSGGRRESVLTHMSTKGKKLPKQLQEMMLPKHKRTGFDWPSPSPGALFQSVASTQWLFHFFSQEGAHERGVNASWGSFLAQPGKVIGQKSTGILLLVLAAAEYAFLGIRMVAKTLDNADAVAYQCDFTKDAIDFHFIVDLGDWVCLQTEAFLSAAGGSRGPIMWRVCRAEDGSLLDQLDLVASALVFGYTLTYLQMKQLAIDLGCKLSGQQPKRQLHEMLIQIAVPQAYMNMAKKHLEQQQVGEEDDLDSNYSEVISELGQDDGNANDLKDLKLKKKNRKLKKALKTQAEIVEAKAAAKSKAKTKPKAKAKRVAAKGLVGSLVEKARKLQKAKQEQKQQEEQKLFDEQMNMDLECVVEAAEAAEDQSGGAAVPSPPGEDADMEEAEQAEQAEQAEAAEHAEPSSSSRDPASSAGIARPKQLHVNKSPMELMGMLSPPGCSLTIGFDDHRIKSVWKVSDSRLKGKGKLAQEHFSLSFASKRSWQAVLQEVHAHIWNKWQIIRSRFPLPVPGSAQVPGEIQQEILDALEPHMLKVISMPPKKQQRKV